MKVNRSKMESMCMNVKEDSRMVRFKVKISEASSE
jgi:hypothetical protein